MLVVDDDPNLNEMLTTALSFTGYDVRGAETAGAAEALVDSFDPDLIVLDVNLPDETGFELCGRQRDQGNETPVIFLTARDDSTDVMTEL